jgi:hypothetical protein
VPCIVQGKALEEEDTCHMRGGGYVSYREKSPSLNLSCPPYSLSFSLTLSHSLSVWGWTAVGDTVSLARKIRHLVFEHVFHYVQTKNIRTLYTYFANMFRGRLSQPDEVQAEYIAPMYCANVHRMYAYERRSI